MENGWPGRKGLLRLPVQAILDACNNSAALRLNVPPGLRAVAVYTDHRTHCLEIGVEGEALYEVPAGCEIPYVGMVEVSKESEPKFTIEALAREVNATSVSVFFPNTTAPPPWEELPDLNKGECLAVARAMAKRFLQAITPVDEQPDGGNSSQGR